MNIYKFNVVRLSCLKFFVGLIVVGLCSVSDAQEADKPLVLPEREGKLVLDESWEGEKINSKRWYMLRKKWGQNNNGVVPENVRLEMDVVGGKKKRVLVCEAHGDLYDGPVVGQWGKKKRVGGVIVSKQFFASGRFEVVMKVGEVKGHSGGPERPAQPRGIVPAIWTYAYRTVRVPEEVADDFIEDNPYYNPHLQQWGKGITFYWSELDFPEYGKEGKYDKAMYNTFLNRMHDNLHFDVKGFADGKYHTYTTIWRTHLREVKEIRDEHVIAHEGYWWVKDKGLSLGLYWGNPFKKLGEDKYALYEGKVAHHWIDGKYIGSNKKWVPSMAAQLNLGVWLPKWAGPAPWKTATVKFASVKVWQFHDEGDVRNVLVEDITDNFDEKGNPVK